MSALGKLIKDVLQEPIGLDRWNHSEEERSGVSVSAALEAAGLEAGEGRDVQRRCRTRVCRAPLSSGENAYCAKCRLKYAKNGRAAYAANGRAWGVAP